MFHVKHLRAKYLKNKKRFVSFCIVDQKEMNLFCYAYRKAFKTYYAIFILEK